MYARLIFCCCLFILSSAWSVSMAQIADDSLTVNKEIKSEQPENILLSEGELTGDTIIKKPINHQRRATIRSAILPGWGQIYNKKYWKLPIVYGALGISAGVFFNNIKMYKDLRQAVIYRRDTIPGNDLLIPLELRIYSTESLISYRNLYRQYIDYSVLAFLALWGLNVIDATVDAHLKEFNVSPDLTLKIRPRYKFETNSGGLSLVFQLRKKDNTFILPH